jgi:hypothetical protein
MEDNQTWEHTQGQLSAAKAAGGCVARTMPRSPSRVVERKGIGRIDAWVMAVYPIPKKAPVESGARSSPAKELRRGAPGDTGAARVFTC